MAAVDLSFSRYVAAHKGAARARVREAAIYAYGGDLRVRSNLDKLRPVTLALDAAARLWVSDKGRLLQGAIQAGERQFPLVFAQVARCAEVLGIPAPPVYLVAEASLPGMRTFGSREEASILVPAALADQLAEAELLFALGRECGRVQSGHVVYLTALHFLAQAGNPVLRFGAQPAVLALGAWARRAHLTADRAGLLCGRDLGAAGSALVKLAVGSAGEAAQSAEYLRILGEAGDDMARLHQGLAAERDLAARIGALRLFAQTAYYLGGAGGEPHPGALSREECDIKVADLLAVLS
jgi:Zn-dependent protease with chaperone function